MGTGWAKGIQWTDLEVRNAMGGAPEVILSGAALDICESKGITEIKITISHCRLFATAFAIAVGKEKS